MADKEVAAVEIETRVGAGKVAHMDQGGPGQKPEVGSRPVADGVTADLPHPDDLDGEVRTKVGVGGEQTPEGEVGKEAEGEPVDAELPALPEFNADDPDTMEAYDAAYLKDGVPDLTPAGRFSKEWFANAAKAKDGVGHLNEATYKYLEGMGFDKATVKGIEAGQMALNKQRVDNLYALAGGKDAYDAMLTWARGGGYDEAARKRFNAALDSDDPAQISEAVAALKAKHAAANPGGRAPANRFRRPNKPERSMEGGGGHGAGVEPFKDHAEYTAAWKEATGPEGTQEKFDLVRKRLLASPWYRKQK